MGSVDASSEGRRAKRVRWKRIRKGAGSGGLFPPIAGFFPWELGWRRGFFVLGRGGDSGLLGAGDQFVNLEGHRCLAAATGDPDDGGEGAEDAEDEAEEEGGEAVHSGSVGADADAVGAFARGGGQERAEMEEGAGADGEAGHGMKGFLGAILVGGSKRYLHPGGWGL